MKSFVVATSLLLLAACSDDAHKRTSLPLVSPHVRAAAPLALGGTGRVGASARALQAKLSELDATDLEARFFADPKNGLYAVLGELDARLIQHDPSHFDCLGAEPVAYTFDVFGEPLTFYAQCALPLTELPSTPPGFLQVGVKDGVVYLFELGAHQRVAARLTPVGTSADAGTAPSDAYRVDAWIGLGYDNAAACGLKNGFDDCPYGVLELHTDESRTSFELSAAGVALGYCGVQIAANASSVFALGSADVAGSCLPTDMLCASAAGLGMASSCSGLSPSAASALGRRDVAGPNGTWAASDFPGESDNTIVLDGTVGDSLWFGPTEPAKVGSK